MFVKARYFGRFYYSIGQSITRKKYDVNVMSLSLNTGFQRSRKFDPLRENTILFSLSVSNKVNILSIECAYTVIQLKLP